MLSINQREDIEKIVYPFNFIRDFSKYLSCVLNKFQISNEEIRNFYKLDNYRFFKFCKILNTIMKEKVNYRW